MSMSHKSYIAKIIYLVIVLSTLSHTILATEFAEVEADYTNYCPEGSCNLKQLNIIETKEFFGLASYYNSFNAYVIDENGVKKLEVDSKYVLEPQQWLAVAGRLNVLLLRTPELEIIVRKEEVEIQNPQHFEQSDAYAGTATKSELLSIAPELDQIRYVHLWGILAWLAKIVESSLVAIQTYVVSSWGLSIVVFSVLLKILLLPVGIKTVRLQRKVSQVQAKLVPKLAEIKAKYDGEEAHNRIMAAHKELGVSLFYTLKPMLASFIQVPILIAVFNVLGEMPQLYGQSFLWIDNLAYPDIAGNLSFSIPMFGNSISLLPFIMTGITLFSTLVYQNRYAPETEVTQQKRNLYLMAAAFFVLFYPFPAAMVLYWALANVLQTIQQQVVKI